MVGTWVLVLLLIAGGRTGATSQRIEGFTTEAHCQSEAAKAEKENPRMVWGGFCIHRR